MRRWHGRTKAEHGGAGRCARALLAAALLGCATLAAVSAEAQAGSVPGAGSAAAAAEADNGAMQGAASAAGMAAGAVRAEQPAEESASARDTAGTGGDAVAGAPERLRMEPVRTSTGFTEIVVDARVEAAGAENAARWQVRPRAFAQAEAEAFLSAMGFDAEGVDLTPAPLPRGATTYRDYAEARLSRSAQGRTLDLWNGYAAGEAVLARLIVTEGRAGAASAQYLTLWPMEEADESACAPGFEAARGRALALAERIAPGLALRAEGFVGNAQAYSQALIARGDGLTALPGAAVPEGYGFVFTRTVDGLPVTATGQETLPNPHGEERPPFACEKLRVLVRDNGALTALYTPMEVLEGTREPVALLPFDSVARIAREALPAALEAREATNPERVPRAAHRVSIDRVTLGYACVQTGVNPDRWELRPVWDFFGRRHFRYYDAREDVWRERYETNLLTSWLTLDAVSGEVIAR